MNNPRAPIRRRLSLLGNQIDAISWEAAIGRISTWASRRESRYVCLCNVHSLVTGRRNVDFRSAVEAADTATPDGMPVAWLMRRRGMHRQERIDGPGLMWRYAEQAAIDGTPIFLYGATTETLETLVRNLHYSFPGLKIAGCYAPPFRPLSREEENDVIDKIGDSGARVVFIGLGCPRQEIWMAEVTWRIPAVLVGVGAAFDYHAGTLQRAPQWMQRHGLEWLFRLCAEPRRLWRRYCVTNTLFFYYLLRERFIRSGRSSGTSIEMR